MASSVQLRGTSLLALSLFLTLGAGTGCVDNYSFAPIPASASASLSSGERMPHAQTDGYNVTTGAPKVDLLFVVDNSGSMSDNQAVLASSFSSFISHFVTRNLDFHLGMITTDISPNPAAGLSSSYISPVRGGLLSRTSEKYFSPATTDLVSKFTANVNVGTSGSGAEQGLASTYLALQPAMIGAGAYNEGFVRSDALLSVVIVSDEDEDIENGDTPEQRTGRVVDLLRTVKGADSKGFRFDYIINASAPAPTTPQIYPSGLLPYPMVYFKAAQIMSSRVVDIASNFGPALDEIGQDITVQLQKRYPLSRHPLGEISVSIDSTPIAVDAINGYVYLSTSNTIELNGDALALSAGRHLSISYTTLDP